MTDSVVCPHCRGEGRMSLAGVYADTLALLRLQPRELNGAELARLAGCKETAMNNRLVRLEQLGFAVSRDCGRQRLWKAADTPTVEMQATTPEEELMATMESMGIPPVCGGSEEAKPEHTPGPWHFEKNGPNHIPAFNIWDQQGMMVGYLGHTRTPGKADANARLIAAAPDLLEALRELLVCVDEKCGGRAEGTSPLVRACDRSREAIAKATS